MKFLFVHRSFPGQFLHLLYALAVEGRHQIVFITQACQNEIPGVLKANYTVTPASDRTHPDAREFDAAMRRAAAVAEVAAGLRATGFVPDVIIGHEGWGETLNLAEVWPTAPQIGYREYFYHISGTDVGFDPEFPLRQSQIAGIRAKNAVGLLALLRGGTGVSPTEWQRSIYPDWSRRTIRLVPDAVDLVACRPDVAARARPFQLGTLRLAPGEKLVTFVARNLEPYRGFHTFARALPRLLRRSDVKVACVGGDGVSYGLAPPSGSWRQLLFAELGGSVDWDRVYAPGMVDYTDYLRLLRRSDVHTYLSYPFIASWSLREAMACGCVVLAGDTAPVREFITNDVNGILARCLDPAAVADHALALLQDVDRAAQLAQGARMWAETNLRMSSHLDSWSAVVRSSCGSDVSDQDLSEP